MRLAVRPTLPAMAALLLAGTAMAQTGPVFDVRSYGAGAAGAKSDSAGVQSAIDACGAAKGGVVYAPPIGRAYQVTSGLVLGANGCALHGDGVPVWSGPLQPNPAWEAASTWFECSDATNPCITVSATGATVSDLNMIWAQPGPPPAGSWAPHPWPYGIVVTQNMWALERIHMVNATKGIRVAYTPASHIGGTYARLRDLWIGHFGTGIRLEGVNDTVFAEDIHFRHLWFIGNDAVTAYREASTRDLELAYVENIQVNGIEFYQSGAAIWVEDGTMTYGTTTLTHGCALCQFSNVLFNQVYQAVSLASGTTAASMQFNNVVAQSDTDTGRAAGVLFNFASDNANVQIGNLWVTYAGHSVMAVGAGKGGRVQIQGQLVSSYSGLAAGSPALVVNGGAELDAAFEGVRGSMSPAAGPVLSGAGIVNGGNTGPALALPVCGVAGLVNGTLCRNGSTNGVQVTP